MIGAIPLFPLYAFKLQFYLYNKWYLFPVRCTRVAVATEQINCEFVTPRLQECCTSDRCVQPSGKPWHTRIKYESMGVRPDKTM